MRKTALFLVLVLILSGLGSGLTSIAFADVTSYSDVLDDLKKDETFDVSQYKEASDIYTLEVIQVAESVNGELFVYVYQPSKNQITASEIRFSTTIGDNLAPKDYKLKLLNINGTLAKYKVENFIVSNDTVRYYYIVQIVRPATEVYDVVHHSNNTISTRPFAVGKLYTACTIDGQVTYGETHEEVITITAKYCGYIRNFTGWIYHKVDTDSHFVAFDTDRPIEKLMEADVTYDYYAYRYNVDALTGLTVPGTTQQDGDVHTGNIAKLQADRSHTVPTIGLFGKEYTWSEIQSVEEFKKQEQLTNDVRKEIEGKKWVLRFWLSPVIEYVPSPLSYYHVIMAYHVVDASILRLKFETNGKVYNLGVVDNKQTEGPTPSNPNPDDNVKDGIEDIRDFFESIKNGLIKFWEWLQVNWWIVLLAVIGIALVVTLIVFMVKKGFVVVCKAVGTGLWYVIKYVSLGLWYLITWPVYLIVYAVRKRKERKDGDG